MEWLADTFGVSIETVNSVLASLGVVAAIFLLRFFLLRWLRTQLEDPADQYRATKLTNAAATVIAIITLIFIWVDAFNSLATYLGLVSAGLAVALTDPVRNMAAWVLIMTRKPFEVGDRIEVTGVRGDVADIRLFRFTLMEIGNWIEGDLPTGRLVHVPNGVVFTDAVSNSTEGFQEIWDEAVTTITFESDVRIAERLMAEAIAEAVPPIVDRARQDIKSTSHEYRLTVPQLEPSVFVRVDDSGVTLFGRYLVDARRRREVASDLWKVVVEKVNATPGVEFAYPTTRTYFEGPIEVSNP